MLAPERFAAWLCGNRQIDKYGHEFRYHPRSDSHSKALCSFIVDDLLDTCSTMQKHAAEGQIAYGINLRATWGTSGGKALDLAIGTPVAPTLVLPPGERIAKVKALSKVLLSCECKAVMTEHSKSKPRLFDELSSSHEIVHRGDQNTIAAGIAVVNIADRYVSPTLNLRTGPLDWTDHGQPHAAATVIEKLGTLPLRESNSGVGFEAFTSFVVNCDNQGPAAAWDNAPAPQPGDHDHYLTFLQRICRFYTERFSVLPEDGEARAIAEK